MEWWALAAYGLLCLVCACWEEYYRSKADALKRENKPGEFKEFLYVLDNIRSCSTFQELNTAADWIKKLDFNLPPEARELLVEESKKKFKELENEMNLQTGGAPKKVQ